jgi:hypothetical protein
MYITSGRGDTLIIQSTRFITVQYFWSLIRDGKARSIAEHITESEAELLGQFD